MKRMKKKLFQVIAGMVLAAGLSGPAWADIPSDFFDLTVTPAGNQGVIIGTTSFDFGSVSLGASTQTAAIPVTSTGSVGPVEYEIRANVTTGSNPWALSTDGTANAQDELEARAAFNTNASVTYGSGTTDLLITTNKSVGDVAGEFEGDVDMDDLALDTTNNLYVRFTLPPTSSSSGPQTVRVTVTGGLAD